MKCVLSADTGMQRKPLYSRTTRRRSGSPLKDDGPSAAWDFEALDQEPSLAALAWRKIKAFAGRHDRSLPAAAAILVTLALIGGWHYFHPGPRQYTQWDIDNAVKYTLDNTPPGPAKTTVAAAIIAPSVVRVDGYLSPEHAAEMAKAAKQSAEERATCKPTRPTPPPKTADAKDTDPDSTGSGVVIDDKGDILTNLHVIRSTDRWVITFYRRQQLRCRSGQCPAGK